MISKIAYTTIISVVILALLHHIYSYLMHNLTVPRVHDMVSRPERRYKEIFEKLHAQDTPLTSAAPVAPAAAGARHSADPDMKNELKDYIKNLTGDSIGGETPHTSPYTAI